MLGSIRSLVATTVVILLVASAALAADPETPPASGDAAAAAPAAPPPAAQPPAAPAKEGEKEADPKTRPAPNSVFAEMLGAGVWYSVNYERRVIDDLGVRAGLVRGQRFVGWIDGERRIQHVQHPGHGRIPRGSERQTRPRSRRWRDFVMGRRFGERFLGWKHDFGLG